MHVGSIWSYLNWVLYCNLSTVDVDDDAYVDVHVDVDVDADGVDAYVDVHVDVDVILLVYLNQSQT